MTELDAYLIRYNTNRIKILEKVKIASNIIIRVLHSDLGPRICPQVQMAQFNLTAPGISKSCDSSYSNGPLEGLNRKIKQISRSGYNFFNRIRLELTKKTLNHLRFKVQNSISTSFDKEP